MAKELNAVVYRPTGTVKGTVLVVHGMQEHQARYEDFAKFLQQNGYVVMTYNLPGHGPESRKDGTYGYFGDQNGWDVLINSAVTGIRKLKEEYPDVPVYYFGHSMGTMIGRCFLMDHDDMIDGMILTGAPCYNSAVGVAKAIGAIIRLNKGKKGHSKTLDKLMTGGFNKGIENPKTPVDWLSWNTDNVQSYVNDPDCGKPFTIQGYMDLMDGMQRMGNVKLYHVKKPDLPIALFAGEDDPCIGGKEGFASTVSTLKQAGYTHISTKLYPHMRHEILHETDAQKVYEDIVFCLESMRTKGDSGVK
ncbi:MAG: alpha/beta fold hydrolase [Lactimicrobium sp.]|jgi:alpha-beta hydrolase superfamily lysophospholipase|uniref:alpha/beta fold hydrolase n=1 Tax=Lactimicrobium sp. TaxID=2563780 RepID=UPI002F356A2A